MNITSTFMSVLKGMCLGNPGSGGCPTGSHPGQQHESTILPHKHQQDCRRQSRGPALPSAIPVPDLFSLFLDHRELKSSSQTSQATLPAYR